MLEDAYFDPVVVRRASRRLSLPSEASFRFERTVDAEMVDWASKRTAQLIIQTAGGQGAKGVIDVYPEKIGTVDYSYGASNTIVKVTIEFAYKQWHNMGLESVRGLEFGHAMQTAADVKARNQGLFGMLPPSLQRAGRNIFDQGRTVWNPIGRIFKGKVFPPFT